MKKKTRVSDPAKFFKRVRSDSQHAQQEENNEQDNRN